MTALGAGAMMHRLKMSFNTSMEAPAAYQPASDWEGHTKAYMEVGIGCRQYNLEKCVLE